MTTERSVQINKINAILSVVPNPHEDLIGYVYLALKAEGLTDTVWHDGDVGLTGVLAWHKNPANVFFACFHEDITTGARDCAGIIWLNSMKRVAGEKVGEVGMAFLSKFQRNDMPQEFAELGLEHLFANVGLDRVYGTTPKDNRAAVIFAKKLGMKEYGIAPGFVQYKGKAVDAVLTCLSREDFMRSSPREVPSDMTEVA